MNRSWVTAHKPVLDRIEKLLVARCAVCGVPCVDRLAPSRYQ